MERKTVTLLLLIGVVAAVFLLAPKIASHPLPGNDRGYSPAQPIAYSHRLHAGELGIACQYCHSGAERSRHAGIPSPSVCMNCHRFVQANMEAARAEDDLAAKEKRPPRRVVSPEIQKIYDALALDENLNPDPKKTPRAVEWVKIHNLPDFVYFDHRRHVTAGVECQQCHGQVQLMERVRQEGNLTMGWCVNCHRSMNGQTLNGKVVRPSNDCMVCHQ